MCHIQALLLIFDLRWQPWGLPAWLGDWWGANRSPGPSTQPNREEIRANCLQADLGQRISASLSLIPLREVAPRCGWRSLWVPTATGPLREAAINAKHAGDKGGLSGAATSRPGAWGKAERVGKAGWEGRSEEEGQEQGQARRGLGLLRRNRDQTHCNGWRLHSVIEDGSFPLELSHLKDKERLFGPAWAQMHILDWDHNHRNRNSPYFHQPFKNKSQPGLEFRRHSLWKKQRWVCLDCRTRVCQKCGACFALNF